MMFKLSICIHAAWANKQIQIEGFREEESFLAIRWTMTVTGRAKSKWWENRKNS